MHNDIQIGPITIHMYGVMIAIGLVMALFVSEKRAEKRGLNDNDMIFHLFLGAIIGGALGTRILYYLVSIPEILKDPSILWNFSNGYVVYGGIIGGILVCMICCKMKKVNFLTYFDLIMPQVALAQGFGRIGCFFAGCCYGRETTSRFSIEYWNSNLAPNGVKLIPTQLMSSAGDFVIFALLLLFARKNTTKGRVGALYLILYSIGRFIIEMFRDDYRGSVGVLSTSQFISIGMFIIGIVLFSWKRKAVQAQENL